MPLFNFNPQTPEQVYRMKKLAFIADIVLILLIGSVGLYIYLNIHNFNILGHDVCKLCMQKTGAVCTYLKP